MTKQVNMLTNQDVMLDLYKIHAYIPNDEAGNPLTPFGNFCEGYQAATQASESEINSLKERVEELQADNTIMRDTLNKIALGHVYDADIIESAGDCLQRLSNSQSLAEHDNATIERIATALENAEGELKYLPEYVALVRALKSI